MSRYFSRFDKSYLILVPVVLHATWPWFSLRLRSIVPFLIFLLWLFVQRNSNALFYQKGKLLVMFGITMVFFVFHSYLRNIFATFDHAQYAFWHEYGATLSAICHFIIVYLSMKNLKFKEIEFLTIVALIGVCLAGIAAFRAGTIEGFEGGRALTTSLEVGNADLIDGKIKAYELGSANYGQTYGFALFCSPLVWALFKVKKILPRLLLIVSAVACAMIVKNSGLGTPVFVLLWGVILLGSTKVGIGKFGVKIIGTTAILFLIIFAYNTKVFAPLASTVHMLGDFFPDESSIQMRCKSVADAFKGDYNSYAVKRYELQRVSIDAFLDNPVLGAGIYNSPNPKAYKVGGHSCLLDRLGQAGIIGGFFYFGFLISLYLYYKQTTICFGFPRQWLLMPLACLFTYVFSCIANPSLTFPAILYYMPGLLLLTLKYGRNESRCVEEANFRMQMS